MKNERRRERGRKKESGRDVLYYTQTNFNSPGASEVFYIMISGKAEIWYASKDECRLTWNLSIG